MLSMRHFKGLSHFLPILAFIALAAGSTDTSSTTSNSPTSESPPDTSWIPSGYTGYDDNIAYRFRKNGEISCGYRDSCWQMEIISKNGCDNLYVELTRLGPAGENVGYTNDTTSNLQPNQKAVLTFSSFDDDKTAQLSKINCY
jgi:hypothetical protein